MAKRKRWWKLVLFFICAILTGVFIVPQVCCASLILSLAAIIMLSREKTAANKIANAAPRDSSWREYEASLAAMLVFAEITSVFALTATITSFVSLKLLWG